MRAYLAVVAVLATFTGCASWSTYNKEREFEGGKSTAVFIDAKQRALLSNLDASGRRRYCAEPSPDALSAFSAKAGLDLTVAGKGELGYSQGFSEAATSIGLRTQSIQLLRDIMFTNCEAYMNEGITEFGLETLQRRFQSTLVAVLAIEQLTGAVKAPAVAISGQAVGNDAQLLGDAIKLVESADAATKAAQAALDSADAAAKTARQEFDAFKKAAPADTASDAYKASKEKSDKADGTLKAAKETLLARQADLAETKAIRAAASDSGGVMSRAILVQDAARPSMDAAAAKEVSAAVMDIVKTTLSLGFGREICTTVFGHSISISLQKSRTENLQELTPMCLSYLRQDVLAAEAMVHRMRSQDENVRNVIQLTGRVMDLVAQKKMDADSAVKLIAAIQNGAVSSAEVQTAQNTHSAVTPQLFTHAVDPGVFLSVKKTKAFEAVSKK